MKILLIGEYSNVHATLAEGLRAIGHQVTVLSNGDFWKNYLRDIDLVRRPGKLGGIAYMCRLHFLLPRLRGYDIVQLINPMFLEIKADRIFPIYNYLRRHNKKVVLCGLGMDWYWVHTCCTSMPLRYSDFNIGTELRTNREAVVEKADWLNTSKEGLNKYIAQDSDAIITGLYEYQVCYLPYFPDKTTYIPMPINCSRLQPTGCFPHRDEGAASRLTLTADRHSRPVKLFIGISKNRSEYKGTDIMLKAARAIAVKYPERVDLLVAEGIPFEQYEQMMNGSDAILDQLYSYTPSMNSLCAMAKGIICIGGGEPENYEIIGETELRPIINVLPDYKSVYYELEQLVLHPERIPELKRQSIEYVKRHHDYIQVARRYEAVYKDISKDGSK